MQPIVLCGARLAANRRPDGFFPKPAAPGSHPGGSFARIGVKKKPAQTAVPNQAAITAPYG
ncbi:Uncharacterised protein [[Flavobacterium] thermophilum]|nr:Uncharacterised protein [[Flavobacterium] thermophilum]